MRLLTESQWERYFSLLDDLSPLSAEARKTVLQSLRCQGREHHDVISLVTLHFALPMEPDRCRLGERIGSFILGEQIGCGGMGVVFRATQDIGREVALKLIHPALLEMDRDAAYARYADEIAMLAKLEHEGIARIYDGGIHDDRATGESYPFFAMQLVRGGTPLTRYATDNGLSTRDRLMLFLQVCEAVQYAHDQGVVHRDLKPANILVDSQGHPVVIDFGLAQACGLLTRPDKRGHLSGTLAYMSPEQVCDDVGCVGPISDVYALGIILYELLAGHRPYQVPHAASYTTIHRTILEAAPSPLETEYTGYSRALDTMVAKALEKRPADRYPSVAALHIALRQYLKAMGHPEPREIGAIGPFYLSDHRLVVSIIKGISGDAVLTMETHAPELAAAMVHFTIGDETGILSLYPTPLLASVWSATYDLGQAFATVASSSPEFTVELPQPEWRHITALLATWAVSPSEQIAPTPSLASRERLRSKQIVLDIVKGYGGRILPRLTSGEIVALFGVTNAGENHAERALKAAIDMGLATADSTIDLSVSIVTDKIYVDPSRDDIEAMALCQQVRQVHALASPGKIRVSETTYRATRQAFAFGSSHHAAGIPPIYPLLMPSTVAEQQDMIGRADVRGALQTCLDRLRTGIGQLVVVFGEAGIGKSRLIADMRAQAGNHIAWLESHASSCMPMLSYAPFRDILWQDAGITWADTGDQAEARLADRAMVLLPQEGEALLPYLLKLAGLGVRGQHENRVKYLTPEALGRQIFHAAFRYLAQMPRERPLVLVFENWQRSDYASRELLAHLLPLIHQVPLLICVVSRAESLNTTARWRQIAADQYHPFEVSPLSPTESVQLLSCLSRHHKWSDQMQQAMVRRAGGNPFFLEEMAFAYQDGKHGDSASSVVLPDTVEAHILSRYRQLPEKLRALLRVGAVIGHSFSLEAIQAVTQIKAAELERSCLDLQRLHFLAKHLSKEQAYQFKHDLLQEAIYQDMCVQQRRALHSEVGTWMEATYKHCLKIWGPHLAYHYAQAEAWEKAKAYLIQVGEQARQVVSDDESLKRYQHVLHLCDDKLEPHEWSILQHQMGEALYQRGDFHQAESLLLRALGKLGHPPPTSRVAERVAIVRHLLRHVGQLAFSKWQKKRAQSGNLTLIAEQVLIMYESLCWIAYSTGQTWRYLLYALSALHLSERVNFLSGAARSHSGLGMSCDFFAIFPLAGHYHRQAVRLADESQDPLARGLAYYCLACHEEFRQDWDHALAHYHQAADIYHACGDTRLWAMPMVCIGRLQTRLGRFVQSLATSCELIRIGQESADTLVQGWGLCRRGDILLRMGSLEEAEQRLLQAIELVRAVPDHHAAAEATGLLGQCYLGQGKMRKALQVLKEREQLMSQHGRRPGNKRLAEVCLAAVEQAASSERRAALDRAQQACRAALKGGRRYSGDMPRAARLYGTYAWLKGRSRTACKWWRRSLRSAERLGARWELGITHLEMGRRLRDTRHLQEAEVILAEMGATLDARQAHTALLHPPDRVRPLARL